MPRVSKRLSTTSKRSSNGIRSLGDGRGGLRTRDLPRVKSDRGASADAPAGCRGCRSSNSTVSDLTTAAVAARYRPLVHVRGDEPWAGQCKCEIESEGWPRRYAK